MRFGLLLSAPDEIVAAAERLKLGPEDSNVLAARLEHAARLVRVGGECREFDVPAAFSRPPKAWTHPQRARLG
jgi:hypothetical protein